MREGDIKQHISTQFNVALEDIRNMVLNMGGLVEQQVGEAVRAFADGDSELADAVARSDYKVNAMEVSIDEKCSQVLALRTPVAGDLRLIVMVIKTITDLERIGDEAEKVARLAGKLADAERPKKQLTEARHMGDHVRKMLQDSLDAYARMDVQAALKVIREDYKVDEEYESTMRQIMTYMMEDSRYISRVLDVVWCIRALERIGDHAKNISEYVVYMVQGKDVRHISLEQMEAELGDA